MNNEELVIKCQRGDEQALETLVEDNRKLVLKIANKYIGINKRAKIEDLEQEGMLGFIHAIKKYDPSNKNKAKLTTYAIYYIDRYIKNYVYGRSEKQKRNNNFYDSCTSLNAPVGKEEDAELGELIEDKKDNYENIVEKLFLEKLRKDLEELMHSILTLEQLQILKYKYGWHIKAMSNVEIADIFDTTDNIIRAKEEKALRTLRNSKWAKKNMKEFEGLGYINSFYVEILKERRWL